MTKEHYEYIEAVARRICAKHGVDPDAKGFLTNPQVANTPRGQFTYVPDGMNIVPLWRMYVEEAEMVTSLAQEVMTFGGVVEVIPESERKSIPLRELTQKRMA